MPEIFREQGFKVVIYFDDHEPAHVHVLKSGAALKIEITGSCKLGKVQGNISQKEANKALKLVRLHQAELLKIWEDTHGK